MNDIELHNRLTNLLITFLAEKMKLEEELEHADNICPDKKLTLDIIARIVRIIQDTSVSEKARYERVIEIQEFLCKVMK